MPIDRVFSVCQCAGVLSRSGGGLRRLAREFPVVFLASVVRKWYVRFPFGRRHGGQVHVPCAAHCCLACRSTPTAGVKLHAHAFLQG